MPLTIKEDLKFFFSTARNAFILYQKNDPLRLAGATAFFTNFALPPILIILIRLFGMFTDRRMLATHLFERLASILDEDSIQQIRSTLRNIRGIDQAWYITLFSFVFFLFVATTLFNVIKNSLEQIWNIGQKDKKGFLNTMKSRAISVIIILLAGILFFIGLLADSIQAIIGAYLNTNSPSFGLILTSILNQIIFVFIVTTWFTMLFRFLTNGRPTWKAALSGGLLTGCLFTAGKYILRILLPLSNISNIYGSAGSLIVIMLFVFYSSLIFYFGASYIKALSIGRETPIIPKNGSFAYEMTEVELEKND
ncbi:YihY/virulence factor BrkB family protein [Pedobacter agri]|uniref:YihY/virulence factor BrkB family protein n=1 Tax=Pedobacter agri TaxID=454586 RepID=A0A9X3DAI0_9SPHI|nr:YihY/virulence factor BrkB family protein [Pedobacter agri]MCX3263566.1 YihY/virulence factor BrkB family protein [Pedobacter agri]MDQ1141965.1 membrane protein [Pedobacter agri]